MEQAGICQTMSKILPCVPASRPARWTICSMLIGVTVIMGAIALYRAISGAVVDTDEPVVGPAGRGGDAGTQGRGGPGGNSNQHLDTTSTTQLFDTLFKFHIGSISACLTVAAAVGGTALATVLLVGG